MIFSLLLDLLSYLGENQWIELMPLSTNCFQAIFSLVDRIKFDASCSWRSWQKFLVGPQVISISRLLPELSFSDCHGLLGDLILYTKDRDPKLIKHIFRNIEAQINPDNTGFSFSMVELIYQRIIEFQLRDEQNMFVIYEIKAMIVDHLFRTGWNTK